MLRGIVVLLVVLFVMLPGEAHAQQEPPTWVIAEGTAACLTDRLRGRHIIGGAWVEEREQGYRVAMSMAYPPPWQGDVYAWIDVTRRPVGTNPGANAPDPYDYTLRRFWNEYRAVHGGYRDEALARAGSECFAYAVYS